MLVVVWNCRMWRLHAGLWRKWSGGEAQVGMQPWMRMGACEASMMTHGDGWNSSRIARIMTVDTRCAQTSRCASLAGRKAFPLKRVS